MNGLGALLFDGKFIPSQSVLSAAYKFSDPGIIEGDDLRKALGAIGVQYSHKNDEILVPSKIEAERAKQSIQVRCRLPLYHQCADNMVFQKRGSKVQRKGKEAQQAQQPIPEWPPRRGRNKKKKQTPMEL